MSDSDSPQSPLWPLEDDDVRDALLAAYADGSWGKYHGPHVPRLEAELAQYFGVPHAFSCASGTIAVEIALRALNLPEGAEVLLAAYDFAGNFRAIQAAGLRPALVDIEPNCWRIDVSQLEAAVTPETKAVLVSHLHGDLADMPAVMEIAQRHQLQVVEDACQSPGAVIGGRKAGTWGDVGTLSFGGSKLLTAGRGGAIVTSRPDVFQRAKVFCERGNHAFPLSELQAAVLLPQLEKLDARNQRRAAAVARLRDATKNSTAWNSPPPCDDSPVYYKVGWYLADPAAREATCARLQSAGVAIDAGFRGFAKRPDSWCRKLGQLPEARRAAEATITLHHPVLLADEAELARAVEVVREVAGG
ncbi:aminotransferase class V-fold PLP-dependent enzyme [Blastopirellula sp. JC732]|uniref:Aminotransferase class V-fold PLP-dependent enzyme n=1 Tax=Blastopirellula sediminis TaxID=2894196 RepID=A0A9X1MR44_9BACT|nr:aminotransferase class V-fold PLP-dependent enzyme [Blastopirellula sediminis]MCC9604703.1 aminotransferase class V-fold PLP-dependent enzyme [Blastopirellula sediminis]MCC9631998.1 aminotransferase class V-fold PLP-dependent enzyme [Blastopirellula sediminis]